MRKIKFIKNTPDGVMKEGDISNASPKNADFAVRTGYAIYEGEEKKSLSEELKNFQSRAEEKIPKQLQNPALRFCLLKPRDKIPFEPKWQQNGYSFDDK